MQGTQHSRLFDRWLGRAPDYVSFGLVIVCGFLLARLTWMLFPAEPRPLLTESATSSVAVLLPRRKAWVTHWRVITCLGFIR